MVCFSVPVCSLIIISVIRFFVILILLASGSKPHPPIQQRGDRQVDFLWDIYGYSSIAKHRWLHVKDNVDNVEVLREGESPVAAARRSQHWFHKEELQEDNRVASQSTH